MTSPRTAFEPPFCPRRTCRYHHDSSGWRFKKIGFYRRQGRPQVVQRYRCRSCKRSFSSQTFSVTYYLKRPDLLPALFYPLLGCSGYRQLGRTFGVSHTTVLRQSERLGRHCLLFQQQFRARAVLDEPLVVDGFESFEYSQYFPCQVHLAVGAHSHFFYAFTDSELRRKGRMTAFQKRRREALEQALGRADPKAIETGMADLLRLVPFARRRVRLLSDEHPAYPRALKRLPEQVFEHRVTSSREPRTGSNPLFPVNLLDLLLRHSSSNHKRETIAFSKRRQNIVEKVAILQVWRNFVKSWSERRRDPPPAVRLGLIERALSVGEVLAERLFPSRIELPERLMQYYRRTLHTRAIPNGRQHRLRLAD